MRPASQGTLGHSLTASRPPVSLGPEGLSLTARRPPLSLGPAGLSLTARRPPLSLGPAGLSLTARRPWLAGRGVGPRSSRFGRSAAPFRSRQLGLTLMEVALAVGILAIMATLTWGAIARSFDAYETVQDIDARYHQVRVAMNRMAKELSMAFLTSERRHNGKERMWVSHFKSEPGSPFQTLDFLSMSNEILRADAKECDQAEIGYFGEQDPDDPRHLNLMRRKDPRPDAEWNKGGRAEVLAEGVKKFSLRFFDPKDDDWTDTWDTEDQEYAGRLPTIVEITLVIEDENGQELTFSTKTRINLIKELGRT